jgi:plastocyanin
MSKLSVLAGIGALALGVAACGGSSGTKTSAATSATAATSAAAGGSSTSLSIAAQPGGALMYTKKTLSAKAGTVTIAFTNMAPLGHNLTIQKGTGATGAIVGATPTFQGATKTLSVKLAPGTYTFYCSVPGHRMAGMQGTLTVS